MASSVGGYPSTVSRESGARDVVSSRRLIAPTLPRRAAFHRRDSASAILRARPPSISSKKCRYIVGFDTPIAEAISSTVMEDAVICST